MKMTCKSVFLLHDLLPHLGCLFERFRLMNSFVEELESLGKAWRG